MSNWKRWTALASWLLLTAWPAQATLVRVATVKGPIDIELYDTTAPRSVANFLTYVRSKAYDASFFHRHARNFVLQGGGYTFPPLTAVTKLAPVQNEFSATRPNVRGSVAMAKLSTNPDSATSEWFINLVDNTTTLGPSNNGGFSVFGRVTAPGMAVVDAIAALQVINAGSPFDTLPVVGLPATGPLAAEHLVMVTSVRELAPTNTTDADRVFNYLEAAFPQYVAPASAPSLTGAGYYFRYYEATHSYVGTKDGNVYYLVPAISNEVKLLGPLNEWLGVAATAGY